MTAHPSRAHAPAAHLLTPTRATTRQAREWYRQDLVGQGIQDSGVARESLFLVSKLHPRNLGREAARKAFEATLADLKTDYLDVSWLCGGTRGPGRKRAAGRPAAE